MPGIREVLNVDPREYAWKAIRDGEEGMRRYRARQRIELYRDEGKNVLREQLETVIKDRTRRERIAEFAPLANAISLFKRLVNERAAPTYAAPPLRKLEPQSEQAVWDAIARESRLNQRMDLACRIMHAANTAFVHCRYTPRLGIILDVLSPDTVTVIPDPEDPTRALGIAYDVQGTRDGRAVIHRVVWDDTEAFRMDETGRPMMMTDSKGQQTLKLTKENGHPGVLPFVDIHLTERSGTYWDSTTGQDAVAGQGVASFCVANMLRLIKTQGHTQIFISTAPGADPKAMPKKQVLDTETPLFGGEGQSAQVLHNPSDPGSWLKVLETVTLSVAANYGLNRDRLNSVQSRDTDMAALLEQREQAIKIFVDAEQRLFDLIKVVSLSHADEKKRLSPDATLGTIDFAEISHKVERIKLLEIWEKEMELGVRNYVDNVMENNPEIPDFAAGEKKLDANLQINTKWKSRFRELNMPKGADISDAGQTPEANGAMGPPVRDGAMSKDDAAAKAATGTKDLRALARKLLKGAA